MSASLAFHKVPLVATARRFRCKETVNNFAVPRLVGLGGDCNMIKCFATILCSPSSHVH
jgi:hypothetical protein